MLITAEILRKICHSLFAARAEKIAELINTVCPRYGVDSKDKLEEFLATVCHESGEFSIKNENMNYTTPQRLIDIWPSRFGKGKLDPAGYIRNPEKLANEVYANRMSNGGPSSGDGFRYRGAGFIQITGKESYQRYAKYKNLTVEDAALKVRTEDEYALDSACWEFFIDKGLMDESIDDDFRRITYRINGGVIGWNDRVLYYERCKLFLV